MTAIADAPKRTSRIPQPTPEELDRIDAARRDLATARDEHLEARDVAKEKKSSYESARGRLESLINAIVRPDKQLGLPIEQGRVDDAVDGDDEGDDIDVSFSETATPAPDDESWREIPIAELPGLTKKIIESLAEANIHTMGNLADYSKNGAPLTMIKGIGEAKADIIDKVQDEFWAARKAAAPPPVDEASEAEASTDEPTADAIEQAADAIEQAADANAQAEAASEEVSEDAA